MTFIYTFRDNPPSPDRLVTRHCRLLSGLPWLRGLRAQVFVWPELSSERQSGPGCAGRVLVPYSTSRGERGPLGAPPVSGAPAAPREDVPRLPQSGQ